MIFHNFSKKSYGLLRKTFFGKVRKKNLQNGWKNSESWEKTLLKKNIFETFTKKVEDFKMNKNLDLEKLQTFFLQNGWKIQNKLK